MLIIFAFALIIIASYWNTEEPSEEFIASSHEENLPEDVEHTFFNYTEGFIASLHKEYYQYHNTC